MALYMPNNESMAAIALTIAAGGAIKSSHTTILMTGAETCGCTKEIGGCCQQIQARPIAFP